MCREVSSLGGVSSHPEGHGVWGCGGGVGHVPYIFFHL